MTRWQSPDGSASVCWQAARGAGRGRAAGRDSGFVAGAHGDRGAGHRCRRHERTGERTAYRNGSRLRTWDTRVGTTELAIRKIRPWTYFPSFVRRTYHKVRVDGRVISLTTVVALGDTTNGGRQVQGRDVGPSEDRDFWTAVLRSLVKRGLHGVRLVVSDANEGLKQAIANGADRHDLATPQAKHGRRSRYLGRFSNQPVAEIVQCGEPISAFRGNSAHRAVF